MNDLIKGLTSIHVISCSRGQRIGTQHLHGYTNRIIKFMPMSTAMIASSKKRVLLEQSGVGTTRFWFLLLAPSTVGLVTRTRYVFGMQEL